MNNGSRAAFIIAEAILNFHIRNMNMYSFSPEFARVVTPSALHELSHFAKQGVKVKLK